MPDELVFTPEVLRDLFKPLAGPHRAAFLRLLGRELSEPEFLEVMRGLSTEIHDKLRRRFFGFFVDHLTPIMLEKTIKYARMNPNATDEEMKEATQQHIDAMVEQIKGQQMAELKAQRDRKSDPENVKRNVEICDRRQQDKNTWSLGKLAQTYGISKRAIAKILEEAQKWRLLDSQSRPTS